MTTRMAAALVMALGSVGGCDAATVCTPYACANGVTLSGNVAAPMLPSSVDVSFGSLSSRHEGIIELGTNRSLASCASQESWSVCLQQGDQGLTVDAHWSYDDNDQAPPDGTAYRLQLTDSATGASLLDVTRTVSHPKTWGDNCHHCWSAELSL